MATSSGKGRRDAGKERFWRETMERSAGSGMSVRAFCAAENLKEAQFYAWRRELRLRDAEASVKPGFAEVVPFPAAGGDERSSGVSVELSCGRRVRVERGFDASVLRAVLEAVAGS